jgi:hypothetical protein
MTGNGPMVELGHAIREIVLQKRRSEAVKLQPRNLILAGLTVCALIGIAAPGLSETVGVTVDPAKPWVGYMNVFELPANGGAYLWGSGWALDALPAVFTGSQLKLSPNTNCYNAADPYWVKPDGSGNKSMNANIYVEDTSLVGKTISFTGLTLANILVPGYASQAFIKVLDPAQGWAIVAQAYAPLVGGQPFSVNLAVANTAGLVPQYGFQTDGVVANPATVGALGFALVAPIPEPASLGLLGLLGALAFRRR